MVVGRLVESDAGDAARFCIASVVGFAFGRKLGSSVLELDYRYLPSLLTVAILMLCCNNADG